MGITRIEDLDVLSLSLGGNVFGWTTDATTAHAFLDAFVDGGGNFVDTAVSYSAWVPGHTGGESERHIGAWLRTRRRGDVVVATKVGLGRRPVKIIVFGGTAPWAVTSPSQWRRRGCVASSVAPPRTSTTRSRGCSGSSSRRCSTGGYPIPRASVAHFMLKAVEDVSHESASVALGQR